MSSKHPPAAATSHRLPNEIIVLIVEAVVPENLKIIALLASHPITKTLLALTLTSSVTYTPAMRLLYSHCVYIDNFTRLAGITRTLQLAAKFENTPEQIALDNLHIRSQQSVRVKLLEWATSIYLAPFSQQQMKSYRLPGEDETHPYHGQLKNICSLFRKVAPKLQRLVFFVPQNVFYEDELLCLYPTFEQFTSLEVWMHAESRDISEPEELSSTQWPNRRVFGFYRASPNDENWKIWASFHRLWRLVSTTCEGLDYNLMNRDSRSSNPTGKGLELVLIDFKVRKMDRPPNCYWDDEWKVHYTEEQNLLDIRQVTVPDSNSADTRLKFQDWVIEKKSWRTGEKFETE